MIAVYGKNVMTDTFSFYESLIHLFINTFGSGSFNHSTASASHIFTATSADFGGESFGSDTNAK